MSDDDKIQIAILRERIDKWMVTTEDYRATLCEKIAELKIGQTKLMESFYGLPCKERGEMYKGMGITLKLLWTSIGVVAGILFAHLGWK